MALPSVTAGLLAYYDAAHASGGMGGSPGINSPPTTPWKQSAGSANAPLTLSGFAYTPASGWMASPYALKTAETTSSETCNSAAGAFTFNGGFTVVVGFCPDTLIDQLFSWKVDLLRMEGASTGFRFGWIHNTGQAAKAEFWSTQSGGTLDLQEPGLSVQKGQWQMLACTWDVASTTAKICRNGAVLASDSTHTLVMPGASTVMYFPDVSCGKVPAAFQVVMIYDHALSAAELAQIYAGWVSATPPADITDVGVLATQSVQSVKVACSASLGGAWLADLSVVGGSVTADSRRSMMRDATVTLAPTDGLSQDDIYDLLSTPGVQLAVSRGFELADGAIVTAPLGVFVIDQLTRIRAGASSGSELTAVCSDLSARISRARWTQPYQIAAGTALADAINQALAFCWAGVETAIDSSVMSNTLGAQAVFEGGADSDPWADISGLADSFGYLLAFDAGGVVRAQSVPVAAAGSPVFAFAVGATAIMTKQQRQLLADQTYNGIIVTGEGSGVDTPPRGEAWDTNPASPTYLYGPFGAVPEFYSSPMITTTDQAQAVAAAMLAGVLGRTEQLSWEQIVHPGLRPLDVVEVDSPDGSSALYLLDSLTIPLTATDAMTAIARTVQAV